MSISLILTLSLGYIGLLFAAVLFNHFKASRELFISSVFVLGVSIVTHLGSYLWLKALPLEQVLGIHYLFFAAIQIVTAGGLFYLNRQHLRVITTITIVLLATEAMLAYAVHLDRNVMALNGALVPNAAGTAQWLLWDLRNYISLASAFAVLLAVVMPPVYHVSKTTLNTEAFEIWEDVEKYLAKFTPSKRIKRANVFMEVALQNMFEAGNNQRDKLITSIGITILNEAIREVCYEPHRTRPVAWYGRFVYWLRS